MRGGIVLIGRVYVSTKQRRIDANIALTREYSLLLCSAAGDRHPDQSATTARRLVDSYLQPAGLHVPWWNDLELCSVAIRQLPHDGTICMRASERAKLTCTRCRRRRLVVPDSRQIGQDAARDVDWHAVLWQEVPVAELHLHEPPCIGRRGLLLVEASQGRTCGANRRRAALALDGGGECSAVHCATDTDIR